VLGFGMPDDGPPVNAKQQGLFHAFALKKITLGKKYNPRF